MKKISSVIIFFLLVSTIQANDSAYVLRYGLQDVIALTKVNSLSWMKLNAIHSHMASYDARISAGSQKPDDFFNRGILKQAIEDNYGALKDFNKAIELDSLHFGSLVNRSVIHFTQKKYIDALKETNALIRMYPDSSILYNNIGYIYQTKNNYNEAVKNYNKALVLNKANITALVNKIRCLMLFKKKKEAKEACTLLHKLHSKDPRTYTVIANYFLEYKDADSAMYYINKGIQVSKNDYEMYAWRAQFNDDLMYNEAEALKDCDTAILLAPKNPQAYIARARPWFDLKEFGKLIADCNKALALDSTMYHALILRGDAYDLLGSVPEALKDYETAIRMYPYAERTYIEIKTLYTARLDNKNAIKTMDRLLKIDSLNENGLMERGKLYMETKQFAEAEKDFSKLAKVNPENSMTWYFWGLAMDSLGQTENACKYMKTAWQLDFEEEQQQHALTQAHFYIINHCPEMIPAAQLKGDELMSDLLKAERISDWKTSVLILDKFLEIYPDSAFFYYIRGKDKRKLGNFETAIVDYKLALKLNPNIPDAWISLGVAQQRTDKLEDAMFSYKQAMKIAPENEMPYNNYGAILTDQKKYAEAIPYFKKAINIKSDYETAIMQLAECYEGLGDKANACRTYKRAEALGNGSAISKRMFICN